MELQAQFFFICVFVLWARLVGSSAQSYEIDHFLVFLAVLVLFPKVLSRERSGLY